MNSYNEAESLSRGIAINMPGLMKDVYAWMAIALVITGFTAYNVSSSPFLLSLILGSRFSMWGLLIATVALVWHLSGSVGRMSLKTVTASFLIYSILNGLMMASISSCTRWPPSAAYFSSPPARSASCPYTAQSQRPIFPAWEASV